MDALFEAATSKSHKHWKHVEVAKGEAHPVHTTHQGYVAEMATIEYNFGKLEADDNGYVVAHINGDVQDNRAENLQ